MKPNLPVTPRSVAESHGQLIQSHVAKVRNVERHRLELGSYMKAITQIAKVEQTPGSHQAAEFEKLLNLESRDGKRYGAYDVACSGWAMADSVGPFLRAEQEKFKQPVTDETRTADELFAESQQLNDLTMNYYLNGTAGRTSSEFKEFLLGRLPALKDFMANTLSEIQSRGFAVMAAEDVSKSRVRNYAESNLGMLRAAALAEAALDGVHIDTPDAISF